MKGFLNVLRLRFKKRDFIVLWSIWLIALTVFFLAVTLRLNNRLEDLKRVDERLSIEIRKLESQIVKSKEVKEKLQELLNLIESYKALLPRSEDINNIAILIGSSARNSGLELERLTFKREKEKHIIFNLRLRGTFLSLIDFLDKIWRSTFLIGIRSLQITATNDVPIINVEIDLVTLER